MGEISNGSNFEWERFRMVCQEALPKDIAFYGCRQCDYDECERCAFLPEAKRRHVELEAGADASPSAGASAAAGETYYADVDADVVKFVSRVGDARARLAAAADSRSRLPEGDSVEDAMA